MSSDEESISGEEATSEEEEVEQQVTTKKKRKSKKKVRARICMVHLFVPVCAQRVRLRGYFSYAFSPLQGESPNIEPLVNVPEDLSGAAGEDGLSIHLNGAIFPTVEDSFHYFCPRFQAEIRIRNEDF